MKNYTKDHSSNKCKGNKPMKLILNASIALLSVSLAGCNLYEPSSLHDRTIQVQEEVLTHEFIVSEVDDNLIAGIARHYTKHGGGDMDLVVTYDPRSYRNTAMQATDKVSQIVTSFRDLGVASVNANIVPIKDQGDNSHMLVRYNSFSASAPEGCDSMMPGMDGRAVGDNDGYKLGCSIDSITARQVAKPKHLLGRGAVGGPKDGRSASNIVDLYRTGSENSELDGERATEE